MYRPDGWCYDGGNASHPCIGESYEAGADAMLEGLKKEGIYLNGDTIIPAQGNFPEIHCPGGTIGYLVVIPEEV